VTEAVVEWVAFLFVPAETFKRASCCPRTMNLIPEFHPDYDKMTVEQLRERRNKVCGIGLAGIAVNGLLLNLDAIVAAYAPSFIDTAHRITESPSVGVPTLLVGIGAVMYSGYMLLDQGAYESSAHAQELRASIEQRRRELGQPSLTEAIKALYKGKRERRKKGPNREYLRPGLPITELYVPLLRRLTGRSEQAVSDSDQSPRPDV